MYNRNTPKEPDVIVTVKELNQKCMKKTAYILIIDEYMIASGFRTDIDCYLQWDGTLLSPENGLGLEETECLYAFVLDPADMPYELPHKLMEDKLIYVIEATGEKLVALQAFETIGEAITHIEWLVKTDECTLDDFAVVIAEEVDLGYRIISTHSAIAESDVYK